MTTADRASLRYVPEVTLGVMPATPAFKNLRFLRDSLNYNIQTDVSKEIRNDRNQADLMNVGAGNEGGLDFELSYGSFDDLIQAVLCGTWTTVTGDTMAVKNGTTKRSFVIQKELTDATPTTYFNYRGCVFDTFNLNISTNQIITGNFGVMGTAATVTESQEAGATFTAVNTNTPFNATQNISSVTIDSVPYTGCINSLSLAVKNGLRPIDCIGTFGHKDINLGKFECTGNFELYFVDKSLYDKFLNSTALKLEITMTDLAGNVYTLLLPRIKFESGQVPVGGTNTDIMFTGSYRALYDATEQCMIKITRNPV